MKWKTLQLSEITHVVTKGTTPTTMGRGFVDCGINFIKAESLNGDSNLDHQTFAFIDEDTHQKLKRSILHDEDVLLTIAGAQVGKCGYVRPEHLPANTNQAVGIIRVVKEKANPRFVYYFFKMPSTFAMCQSIGAAQAAQPNVNLTVLRAVQIPLPKLDAQARVAEFLTTYDDLIENNRRRIALLEESARMLYREWFVHLRFPGHESTRMVDGLPKGWTQKTLGDLCETIRDSVSPDQVDPETPYIGLEHIPRRSIALGEWETAEKVTSNKFRFHEGEILFGKIRPYFHKVGIAFVDGIASSDAIVIRPNEESLRAIVLMTVSSDAFIAEASQGMKEGSKMPRADWKQLIHYPVSIPPEPLMNQFSASIETVTEQLKNLTFQNQKLKTARDLLLPKLMSGEIEV